MPRIAIVMLLLGLPSVALAAEPKVEVIAHRGASHDAPENTLAAIRLAWQQRADGSEFDVSLSRDGKIVVIHDSDTKRTAGVDKKVSEQTLAELRQLDVGRWRGEKFAGEKIPTLDEMLATVPAGKKVYIEVKCGPEIVPELDRVLKASQLAVAQTPVISFNAQVIAAMKKGRPDVPAYWIVSLKPKKGEKPPTAEALIAKARAIRADGLDLSADDTLDRAFAEKVKAAGLRLDVWTVDDPGLAKRLTTIGVDGITTNRPGWLREQLAK